jgi:hypothetical protein
MRVAAVNTKNPNSNFFILGVSLLVIVIIGNIMGKCETRNSLIAGY